MENLIELKKNKHGDKFKQEVTWLAEMLGSEKALMPNKKVASDDIADLVNELFEEDNKRNREEVKGMFKKVLEQYHAYSVERSQKIKEIEALDEKKMEEFNKAVNSIKARIQFVKDKNQALQEGAAKATSSDGAAELSPNQEP